jgi:hypothetical protein
MSGDIPPLPQYAFMAWCSVKKKKFWYTSPTPNFMKTHPAVWVQQTGGGIHLHQNRSFHVLREKPNNKSERNAAKKKIRNVSQKRDHMS